MRVVVLVGDMTHSWERERGVDYSHEVLRSCDGGLEGSDWKSTSLELQ
jgi:hypothetical protein